MKKTYSHITSKERDWIGQMRALNRSIRHIAHFLDRSPSSISREVRRNQGEMFGVKGYYPNIACRSATKRKTEAHMIGRIRDKFILSYVKARLHDRWSPELIAGRLPQEHPGYKISHETIYQWIYAEAKEFIPYLARRKRIRRKKLLRNPQRHHIPSRVGIEERPKHIEDRQEVGHWEVDTVGVDQYLPTLQIMTERKTRYTKIRKIDKASAILSREAIVKCFLNMPRHLIKTLTYDNGSENCHHHYVNIRLGSRSYFCRPYHSWERGTVENTIGLIRRIYPKTTRFDKITDRQVKRLQQWLNGRPKKCLGFKTPYEVFSKERCCT